MCVDGHLGAYSKLLLASEGQVLGLLQEEKEALRTQLCVEADDPQACFIQSALHQLQVHTHTFNTLENVPHTLKHDDNYTSLGHLMSCTCWKSQ